MICHGLSDHNFLAVVDVDAGGGGNVLAHGLARQVVVIVVHRATRLVGHHLIDAVKGAFMIAHSFVDDLAVFHHVTQPAPLLMVGIGIRLASEWSEQVTHVITVKADALNYIGQRITVLSYIGKTVTFNPLDN